MNQLLVLLLSLCGGYAPPPGTLYTADGLPVGIYQSHEFRGASSRVLLQINLTVLDESRGRIRSMIDGGDWVGFEVSALYPAKDGWLYSPAGQPLFQYKSTLTCSR